VGDFPRIGKINGKTFDFHPPEPSIPPRFPHRINRSHPNSRGR
jgi:hypothetical protein